jgi:hypothetical protein
MVTLLTEIMVVSIKFTWLLGCFCELATEEQYFPYPSLKAYDESVMNALPLWQLLTIAFAPALLTLYGARLHRRSVNRIGLKIDRHIERLDTEDLDFRQEHNKLRRRLELPPV